jgi:hypothetical protein
MSNSAITIGFVFGDFCIEAEDTIQNETKYRQLLSEIESGEKTEAEARSVFRAWIK